MQQFIYNYLKNNNLLSSEDTTATNFLNVIGNEIVISGNKMGLILLADYILNIALSENNGKHIHLDDDNFFDKAEKQLILELKK